MILHKILRGDQAGLYLPFAMSRLKALERISPRGFFVQKFELDGYSIEVQQAPPFQYIRIVAGGYYFEFLTSGRPTMINPGPAYRAAAVGVTVAGTKAKARLRGGTRADDAATVTINGRPHQVTLVDEPVGYPIKVGARSYQRALFDSWAPNHAHTGLHFRCYNMQGGGSWTGRGAYTTWAARDVGFDAPFMDALGKGHAREAFIRNDADWPRANGIQTVKDDLFGTREFALYFDAFNQIHIFPTAAIGPLHTDDVTAQNVDEIDVQHRAIPLPDWVYAPTTKLIDLGEDNGTPGLLEYPEYDWKVHPDGTKACAVVYERDPVSFDAGYYAVNQGTSPLDSTQFAAYAATTGVGARFAEVEQAGYLEQRYNSAPGLVEVTIKITLNGDNLNDFDVTLELTEIRRPTTSELCTVLAGYCWQDIKSDDFTDQNQHYDAKRGEMVVLDIERYWRDDGAWTSFFSLKNLTQAAKELQSFYGSKLLDYDLPTLSFVLYIPDDATLVRALAPRAGSGGSVQNYTYDVRHFGVNVFTLNRQREVLYPDTIDPTIKAQIEGIKTSQARDAMATAGGTWTLMPLNDLRDWTDATLGNLRDWYATSVFHYKNVVGATFPDTVTNNWWTFALNVYFPPTGLLYISNPKFGWYLYTDELLNRLCVTPSTTFFAHPNGTWAYYDQQWLYNTYGVPQGIVVIHDALTPFDVTQIEHVILDRVHLASPTGKGAGIDTSFRELYNQAVQTGTDNNTLVETFDQLAKADLRAALTKETYTHPGDGLQWLQLRMDWYNGFTAYYMEPAYQGGPFTGTGFAQSGGLLDLSLGNLWYAEPGYSGLFRPPQTQHQPVTFSSCILIS